MTSESPLGALGDRYAALGLAHSSKTIQLIHLNHARLGAATVLTGEFAAEPAPVFPATSCDSKNIMWKELLRDLSRNAVFVSVLSGCIYHKSPLSVPHFYNANS